MNTTIIDNFKAFLQKQNYSKSTITGYIRAVQDLKDPPIEGSIAIFIEYIDKALELKRKTLTKSNINYARAALNKLFFWLTGKEIKEARKQVYILDKEESNLLHQYRDYCSNFLHLTPAVTDSAVREVKLFLSYISDDSENVDWSVITADDVIRFLSAYRSELRLSSLGVTVTSIRRLFREGVEGVPVTVKIL